MTVDTRSLANWLVSSAVLLGLVILGRPLLVPLLFAILLWSVLNTLSNRLMHVGIPSWAAWFGSSVSLVAVLYLVARILGNEAAALASRGPVYIAKFEAMFSSWLSFLHLGQAMKLSDFVSRSDVAGVLGQTAASVSDLLFQLLLIVIYVGFLLSEQRHLPAKLSELMRDDVSRDKGKKVIGTVAGQLQAYLGVCTLLSGVMAGATYILLTVLGVDFAGFWALIMFLLTYIPTIGAVGVLLPALMALVQFGSLETFLLVAIALGAVHFLLANVVQTILLGRSLNLSALAIILSLSFWGMIWGIAGLFLAVPIMATVAIVCEHVEGLRWISIALAGPPTTRSKN